MGNCLRHEATTEWGGEEWDFLCTEKDDDRKEGLLHGDGRDLVLSASDDDQLREKATTAKDGVKIKITKKELKELLGTVNDMRDLSVKQVLAHLISVSDRLETHHQRSWKPALQSIPEVN